MARGYFRVEIVVRAGRESNEVNLEVHLECSEVLRLLCFRIVDVVIFSYLLLMQKWEDLVLS